MCRRSREDFIDGAISRSRKVPKILSKCQDFCDNDWLENYGKTKDVKASSDTSVVAPEEDERINTEDLTDSLMARVAHLSVEKDSASLFTIITSGPGE
jgi:hypothetical protein